MGTGSDTVLLGPVLGSLCADCISVFPPVADPVQAWRRRVWPPPKSTRKKLIWGIMVSLINILRYVGVIWFFFMFSNFYQLDLHNEICVAIANLQ